MTGGQVDRVAVEEEPTAERARRSAAEAAWLVAIPCALALVAALLLLGPLLSDALYAARPTIELLPGDRAKLTPEPRETASYLIALCGAVLFALAIPALARSSRWRGTGRRGAIAVRGAQIAAAAFVVVCFAAQHDAAWRIAYFTVPTLVVAAILAGGLALAAPTAWARRHDVRVDRSRAWRALLGAGACAAAVVWVLTAVNTEASITWSLFHYDTAFAVDETFAVLNGLTPLADFNSQYASLLPYAIALPMLAFGKTVLVFTLAACALSVLALLAVYGVLRRAAGSAFVALLLFVPFVATSLFDPLGSSAIRFNASMYLPMLPLRYCGPYLLAWVLARHLESSSRVRAWLLFAVAGLVALNNVDFGVAALAGTVAALLVTRVEHPRQLAPLARSAAIGLAAALAVVTAITLLRAGSLPDLGARSHFARLYGLAGYSTAPLPAVLGLPLIIYLTYAAAIATAVVRAVDRAPNRVLTGMLAWSGVFGLLTASYYVARSEATLMPFTFSAWALALALLTVAVLEATAAGRARRPSLPALVVLFGMGLAICSIAQVPPPWTELRRIQTPPTGSAYTPEWSPAPPQTAEAREFVGSAPDGSGRLVMRPGAPVAIFLTTGHRIADAYDVVNVVPVTGPDTIHTLGELEAALDVLREAGGSTVLLPPERVAPLHEALERRGFRILTEDGVRTAPIEGGDAPPDALVVNGLTKWVDTQRLSAAASG